VLICFFFIWRVKYSHWGRSFLSVRDDEVAAEAMGVPTTKIKVISFVLSSFFAGVAGVLVFAGIIPGFSVKCASVSISPSFGIRFEVNVMYLDTNSFWNTSHRAERTQ
jgi:ABC-type branched-subunit amino acid transport system permease subunit